MTLTDFLLARIAEDEARVRQHGTYAVGHDPDRCCYEGGYEGTGACNCGAVERALAECEAKRRIVAKSQIPPEDGGYGDGMQVALEFLAAVYRDHPDYDPAWAPTA